MSLESTLEVPHMSCEVNSVLDCKIWMDKRNKDIKMNLNEEREGGGGRGRGREEEEEEEGEGEGECVWTYCRTSFLYSLTSFAYRSLADGVSFVYLTSDVEQASI